jgi:hypothetical protein
MQIFFCLVIADVTGTRQLNARLHAVRYEWELPGLHQNEGTAYTN